MTSRLILAHLPTPLVQPKRLAKHLGIDLWIKRDDSTGGAESGNKVRKLEYLLADAVQQGANVVITCGGIQSNHARATALCAAALGMRAVLFLRTKEESRNIANEPLTGNVLLDRFAGAEIRLITPAQYAARNALMEEAAAELRDAGQRPYVIVEGGSSGLGAFGYIEAMREIRRQLDMGLGGSKPFDVIVHACGSGGTAAGTALGAALHGVAAQVRPMAVCDDAPTFEAIIGRIIAEAREIDPAVGEPANVVVDDRAKGPAYAVSTQEQRARMVLATRLSGLVFDPVYTGKALSGLWDLCESGELSGKRVLFLHTGGLPGLLAQGSTFADDV
ncbi:MAG: D-cysteine desulfhydrase family protein [Polyangiaceae bacterium]|nr:D-cysteine desulfhydrase family protein [Polyangiaceae bacterium]